MTPTGEASQHCSHHHSHAWAWGHGGCRAVGLQQNPLLCPVQVFPLQHQLPRSTPGAHYKINRCSQKFPVPLDPIAVPWQGGREWPNGQLLSSGYSFPTRTSLLGIKSWHIKRRVRWVRTGLWWVHVAPLSVSLFATFTLVYSSLQSAGPQGKPLPGESLPPPILLMRAITNSWARLWKCLRSGRGKSIPTGLHRICSTAEHPSK